MSGLEGVKQTAYVPKGVKGGKQQGKKPVAAELAPAAAVVAEVAAVAAPAAEPEPPVEPTEADLQTNAKLCRVYGGGIEEATVRQHVRPRHRPACPVYKTS